jgi:putative glutamine amidotransferase
MNCRLNGSLINDIETIRGTNHRKLENGSDRLHEVRVFNDSLLKEITELDKGLVNSSHHQAADRLGEGLRVTAKALDGIIEAFEWAQRDSKPFMLCVQWHPERLIGGTDEFAGNILKRFKEETERN